MSYEIKDHIVNIPLWRRVVSFLVFWFALAVVMVYDWAVFGLVVVGRRNLRGLRDRPCFLISNHTLYLDPALVGHAIAPLRTRFTALKKTFAIPFVGNLIRYLGAIPVPESNGLQRLLGPVRKLIDSGWCVHFFPEGDLKHRNQSPAVFSPGVFFFSQLLDRPIVPVTTVLLPRAILGREISARFFRVKVVIGEPIDPAGFRTAGRGLRDSVEAMASYAHRIMCECIRAERARYLPPGSAEVPRHAELRQDGDERIARPSNW